MATVHPQLLKEKSETGKSSKSIILRISKFNPKKDFHCSISELDYCVGCNFRSKKLS